jgi:hypothetical protein
MGMATAFLLCFYRGNKCFFLILPFRCPYPLLGSRNMGLHAAEGTNSIPNCRAFLTSALSIFSLYFFSYSSKPCST